MNLGILIAVIVFEVLTIGGVGIFLNIKQKHQVQTEGSFAFANKGLSTAHVGVTLALTMLGSAHIWGTTENAYGMGAVAAWFGIACTVMMVVITKVTGPWIRKIGTPTIPDLFGKLFGQKTRLLTACVMGPLVFGCLCLETQCIAITFQALTGWPYWAGAAVGGIFGILYVLIAGMKEISWLNMINAVFMYVSLIVALIAMFIYLPQGWEGVANTLESGGNSWMMSIFGNSDLIIAFAIPTIFTTSLFQGISQMGMQTCIAAKDVKAVKKSLWLAGGVNGMFCVIPALMGLAAFALVDYTGFGPMLASPMMMLGLLPKWVVFMIMASFLGALLSTFAMTSLCPATIFSHDLFAGLYNKKATEKQKVLVMRIVILVVGILAITLSNFQPAVVPTINWIFVWAAPMFVMAVIGLWWKRNAGAALITMFVSWIVNMAWTTFGLQTKLNLPLVHAVYVTLAASIIFGVITTALMPGKIGLFKEMKLEKAK